MSEERDCIDNVESLERALARVRKAQEIFGTYSQEQVDKIFAAAAIAANQARIPLAEMAVEETGIREIPANTVIMSFKLSIGKTAITSEPMYSNEAIMAFHDKHIANLIPDYI